MSTDLVPYRDMTVAEAAALAAPFMPEQTAMDLLWNETAFPFEPITDSLVKLAALA
jgi:hypothetical protein